MLPELKRVTLDGKPVTNETEFLKEFPASVYMSLYDKWENCTDAKERGLTVLLHGSTVLLLSLWKDGAPFLRGFATNYLTENDNRPDLDDGKVNPPIVLPFDLPGIMRTLTADEFVLMVDAFTDELSKEYLDDMTKLLDDHIAPLSAEKKEALKNA